MSKRRARKRIRVAITIAHIACLRKCRDVTADARPLEALCNAAQRRFVTVVRGFVQRAEHLFAKGGKDNNASGDDALIAMLEERVFDYELWPHIHECFQRRILFQLVCVGARVRVQEVDNSCDCWVSVVLRDLVGARVEAIDFCDGANVGRDATWELYEDLSVD